MGLLILSSSLVTAEAVVGKAVGTWSARRPFGGVGNGRFAASIGTVGRSGRIRRSRGHFALTWVLSVRVRKGFGREREGGRIIVHGDGGDRDTGLTPIFQSGMFDALFLCEKVWGGIMLVCY